MTVAGPGRTGIDLRWGRGAGPLEEGDIRVIAGIPTDANAVQDHARGTEVQQQQILGAWRDRIKCVVGRCSAGAFAAACRAKTGSSLRRQVRACVIAARAGCGEVRGGTGASTVCRPSRRRCDDTRGPGAIPGITVIARVGGVLRAAVARAAVQVPRRLRHRAGGNRQTR